MLMYWLSETNKSLQFPLKVCGCDGEGWRQRGYGGPGLSTAGTGESALQRCGE